MRQEKYLVVQTLHSKLWLCGWLLWGVFRGGHERGALNMKFIHSFQSVNWPVLGHQYLSVPRRVANFLHISTFRAHIKL